MKQSYITMEKACRRLLSCAGVPGVPQPVPVFDAIGRILAQDVHAQIHQPPFDRSPLDGYALRHEDLAGASRESPAVLRVTQEIFAGDAPAGALLAGQAARVMTGAPVPPGADCVVRQEDTLRQGEQVHVFVPLAHHQNYCFAGEDIAKGDLLLSRGIRLDYAAAACMAGQGMAEVQVYPRVPVGVCSTGSELVLAGEPLSPGKIYDSNSTLLAGRVQEAGGIPVVMPAVKDDPALLADAVSQLMERCPLVLTTGGVSVGAHDYMPQVAQQLGMEELFHGVAFKPGGPVMACRKGDCLLIALSGNPFAAMVDFELLGMPVLRKLAGMEQVYATRVTGVLQDSFGKPSPGRRFVRGRLAGGAISLPQGHASGVLSSLIGCNCLVDIPAGSPPLEKQAAVEALLIE